LHKNDIGVDPFWRLVRLINMSIRSIRQELRERLISGRCDGVGAVLAELRKLAANDDELLVEHARWSLRFELLSHATSGWVRASAPQNN
jgi:hypothetical protein